MCPRKQTNSLRSLQKDRDSAGFVTMWDQGWVVARPMLVQITLDKGSECFIFPKIVGGGSCGRPRSTGPSGSRMTILASVGYVTELLRIQKMQNPLYKCLFWLWQVHRLHQHYLCPVHQLRPVYQICPAHQPRSVYQIRPAHQLCPVHQLRPVHQLCPVHQLHQVYELRPVHQNSGLKDFIRCFCEDIDLSSILKYHSLEETD